MTAPELSARERDTLARIESTPAAPESFDATAALRRVVALADYYDTDDEPDLPKTQVAIFRAVARDIRRTLAGAAA